MIAKGNSTLPYKKVIGWGGGGVLGGSNGGDLEAACSTVKILKIGTPEIITIIVLLLEQLDFTVQYCVQKMQTE